MGFWKTIFKDYSLLLIYLLPISPLFSTRRRYCLTLVPRIQHNWTALQLTNPYNWNTEMWSLLLIVLSGKSQLDGKECSSDSPQTSFAHHLWSFINAKEYQCLNWSFPTLLLNVKSYRHMGLMGSSSRIWAQITVPTKGDLVLKEFHLVVLWNCIRFLGFFSF